ncbi:mono/diheme cytochrome c family protein [Virgibacillus natechei]|uniref:Mono/diheme cytochrome c family protein n=1 Tax=Virgibacillus natechei TaxID=1216297 RepID=A0ABS4IHA6_9BACI|nr:cytochrome c [Virgibacillus natechei]MBP1969384.1 mono/diheme cytochrome c family protein [Virgibacillus natechei]UZD11900.1 cytochrome c [Virgibacillus natechei]
MKKWLFTLLFSSFLVLGACGGGGDDDGATEDPADNGDNGTEEGASVDTAQAEEIYESNCAACHGADLSGGAGPGLTEAGATYSAEEIKDIVNNGMGSMQPVDVPEDELDELATWLAGME